MLEILYIMLLSPALWMWKWFYTCTKIHVWGITDKETEVFFMIVSFLLLGPAHPCTFLVCMKGCKEAYSYSLNSC